MPHPVHGERPPGVMLASPAPSDESGTDSEPELSFYYTTDDRGQFVRRSKTPTITSATTLPTQPPSSSSSPVSSTEGSSPVTGSSTARPTRGRSESNVMSGSASMGGVRPFSRVASAAAAVPVATGRFAPTNYAEIHNKENRHPLEYARTPAALASSTGLARTAMRSVKRFDDEDAPLPEYTGDDPYVRPASGMSMNVTQRARLRDEPYPYSSTSALTRTPSVTATLTRPRTAGPKRVTMAEKMKQEEDVRREIEEQLKRDEERRAREEEEEERRRVDEDERRRVEAEQRRRAAEEEQRRRAAEEELRRRAEEEEQQRQQQQYAPSGASAEGWYGERYQHRRRESETAMPAPLARHSPSAPKHMRAADAPPPGLGYGHPSSSSSANMYAATNGYQSAAAASGYQSAAASNAYPSSAPRHKRSPTAPEPRAQQVQAARAEEPSGGERRRDESVSVNKKTYRKLNLLGKGGTSRVYMVTGERNELFALKRVGLENADDQTVQGYLNEINMLHRLEGNKRIIRLFDSEVQLVSNKRVLFMVLECGETDLAKLMAERQSEALEMDWVRYYWRQMLQAVQVIHDEKIVHSDLKPANFVLVKGCLKLIDFGIANAIANDTTNIQRDHQIGTVNFMSPEALEVVPDGMRRFKVGRPSDVWSLGCILYQMVYGHTPFANLSVYHKMKAIPDPNYPISFLDTNVPILKTSSGGAGPSTPPRRLEELARPVPRAAIETMQSCLVRAPKERATIPELLTDALLAPPPPMQVPNPHTDAGMSFVNGAYLDQVLEHVIAKAGGVMTPEVRMGHAVEMVGELRRVFNLDDAIVQAATQYANATG